MNENRRRINRGLLIGLAVQLVILAVVGGFVYSKYVKQDKLNGTLNITAELGKIQLLEHEAVKTDKGDYIFTEILLPTETKKGNTYDHVLPGLDIPKDPYIKVEGKTPIPAYIFVEVVADENFDEYNGHVQNKLAYSLTSSWKKLDIAGENGGTVYVYVDGEGNPIKVTGNIFELHILVDDKIIVSQKVSIDPPAKLKFYATMAQAYSNDAVAVYNSLDTTP